MEEVGKSYYFAYGSNLKESRFKLNSPRAEFLNTAKLLDYKLVFQGHDSAKWQGASASITEHPGTEVYGVLWKLHPEEVGSLDDQEGVSQGIYKKITLSVTTPEGNVVKCFSYQQPSHKKLGLPSPHYLKVLIEGAQEVGLPPDYIEKLHNIEHNDYKGEVCLAPGYVVKI